jgi:glycosyltransferase involved in cell wall biosynthesis
MPTHGRRDLVERALASLAAQEDAPEFEVVVIDDGADPGLGAHVESLGLGIDVRVLHHGENRGRSAARNTGIAAARGDVVAFLDGDMQVVPRFLAAHAAAHAAGAGGAGGDAATDTVVLGNIVTAPEIPRTAFVEYIDSRGVKKVAAGEPIPPRYFMTGNSSVAAPLLASAGGFDPEFDEYGGEDTEMGYRLGTSGARFLYAPDAVSHHLDLNSVPRMARRLRRYGERMLPILVRKVPPAREELRLDLVDGTGGGVVARLRRLVVSAVCRRMFWAPAARVGGWLPRGVRFDALFDFVRAAAYLDGYREAIRREAAAGSRVRSAPSTEASDRPRSGEADGGAA